MKLSISNIGWDAEQDEAVYRLMGAYGFSGLEIAPTRIFPEAPYSQREAAKRWSENLKAQYGFGVSSMQSIWYGRQEKLFGNEEERQVLLAYTKEAIDFAAAAGCGNLVFGCPRNRNVPEGIRPEQVEEIACGFFHELGEYAYSKGTALSIEANPPIYHTNYINDTRDALDLVEKVGSRGFLLNLDVGTMVACGETPAVLEGRAHLVRHVHISEPGLSPLQKRPLHGQLLAFLGQQGYSRFVSVEMGKQSQLEKIEDTLHYVWGLLDR